MLHKIFIEDKNTPLQGETFSKNPNPPPLPKSSVTAAPTDDPRGQTSPPNKNQQPKHTQQKQTNQKHSLQTQTHTPNLPTPSNKPTITNSIFKKKPVKPLSKTINKKKKQKTQHHKTNTTAQPNNQSSHTNTLTKINHHAPTHPPPLPHTTQLLNHHASQLNGTLYLLMKL